MRFIFSGGLGLLVFALSWNSVSAESTQDGLCESSNGVTNDVCYDLSAVLEKEMTQAACDSYFALSDAEKEKASEELLLQCGKYQFFYEAFDTTGMPKAMVDFLVKYFGKEKKGVFGRKLNNDYFGEGFSNFGMYPDPNSDQGYPVGFADSTGAFGGTAWGYGTDVVSFTCASCHFSQMEDGRYAAGVANMNVDYSKFSAALFATVSIATDPTSKMQTLNDAVYEKFTEEFYPRQVEIKFDPLHSAQYWADVAGIGLDSAGRVGFQAMLTSTMSKELQAAMYHTPKGVGDMLLPPLLDDENYSFIRFISIVNLPSEEQRSAHGMPHDMFGWTSNAKSTTDVLEGFISLAKSPDPQGSQCREINGTDGPCTRPEFDFWLADGPTKERINTYPLRVYVASLKKPSMTDAQVASTDWDAVARGEVIFEQAGCAGCHSGPDYQSNKLYTYDELGVNNNAQLMFMPVKDEDGLWYPGLPDARRVMGELSLKLKAPRLVKLAQQKRFLHNGSITSLRELLTCESSRTPVMVPEVAQLELVMTDPDLPYYGNYDQPWSNKGHDFGCQLTEGQKNDLLSFLNTL